jgi:predicted dehydrogenase
MSANPIKVGIVGLGAIGERLIQAFKPHSEIEVSAVCDINAERAKQVATELGDIKWFTQHKDLLEKAEVDMVYVAVPPAFHQDVVLDTLQARKHVLCEKPLANSTEEAKVMLEAAERAGVIHAMNFPLNYSSSTIKFAQLIEEGYVGEVRRIGLTLHFPQWPRQWQQNAWVGGKEQGGFILEVGAHFVQLIQRLFGQITQIQSELQFPEDPKACETGIIARMELDDGTPILVDGLSQIAGEEHLALTIYGTEGTLSLENWRQLKGAKLGETLNEISVEDVTPPAGLIENLIQAVQGKPSELYDFNVGYEVQLVLEALRDPDRESGM